MANRKPLVIDSTGNTVEILNSDTLLSTLAAITTLTVGALTISTSAVGITQSFGDNTTALATTAFVQQAVVGLWDDRGSYDASTNLFPAAGGSGAAGAILKGDIWTINVAGVLGGVAAPVGATVRSLIDTPGQTAANWSVMELNLGYAPLNSAAATANGVLLGTGGTSVGVAAPSVAGQLLIDQGAGVNPAFMPLTGDAVIAATGTLTLNSAISTAVSFSNLQATTVAASAAASTAAMLLSGSIYTAGTTTTNYPVLLLQTTGFAAAQWNGAGTFFGINALTGFAGNFIDCHVNGGASLFRVAGSGSIFINNNFLIGTAGINVNNGAVPTAIGTGTTTAATTIGPGTRINATTAGVGVGIGAITPTAYLMLGAGTATAGTSPLKFSSGTLLTTSEAGAVEYDGTDFWTSNSVGRFALARQGAPVVFSANTLGSSFSGGGSLLILNAAASTNRLIEFDTAGVATWKVGTLTTGSFIWNNYDGTGTQIDSPLSIVTGAFGALSITRPVTITKASSSTSNAVMFAVGLSAINISPSNSTTVASTFRAGGAVLTDASTAVSGSISDYSVSVFQGGTLAAANTGVTTSHMYSVYCDGPVTVGTNETVTSTYGLFIASKAVGAASNSCGFRVDASTGATNNYAALLNGPVGVKILLPTAYLHFGAGTATAGTSPLKFTSGVNLTTAETGAMEYNGTNLLFTRTGSTRESVLTGNAGATAPATTAGAVITNFYGSSATNFLGTPNSWVSVSINGTTYKIPLYT